jgi:hypothetical protein
MKSLYNNVINNYLYIEIWEADSLIKNTFFEGETEVFTKKLLQVPSVRYYRT